MLLIEKRNNKWLILFSVVMMTFMACLDGSVVNVALPVMLKNFSVNIQNIQWVVTIYLIVISSAILIGGRLGDIKGKTSIFKCGITLFTIGSLLCGISNSIYSLIIARAIQAIGASGTMSNSFGIITQTFPYEERGRVLGVQSTFVALGTLVGPPLGGVIVSNFGWNFIFLINVPIGIITLALATKIFPKMDTLDEKLDFKGAILFALSIISLFLSLIYGQNIGYKNPVIIMGFLFSLVFIFLFIFVESREKMPLLKLELFKNKLFSISVFCGVISSVAISGLNIIHPFYLQDVLKLSPGITGIIMMVSPVVLCIIAPISGYLSDKFGSEILTLIGLVFINIGLLLMAKLNENSTILIILIFMGIISVGNGLFQSPNTSLIMSLVSKKYLGIAGSVNALVRNIGFVFGISMSTLILYNRMSYKIGYKVYDFVVGKEYIFAYGMSYVYIISAGICFIGVIITSIRLYNCKRYEKIVNENKEINDVI
ncbi:MAG: MFS transporter [Clostridium sp.]|uniref:MFS transporter n=1 Tax=Clostridium sp. TaxID=1506 RepID=UPI0039EBD2A6